MLPFDSCDRHLVGQHHPILCAKLAVCSGQLLLERRLLHLHYEAHERDRMLAVWRRAQLRELGPSCLEVRLEDLRLGMRDESVHDREGGDEGV